MFPVQLHPVEFSPADIVQENHTVALLDLEQRSRFLWQCEAPLSFSICRAGRQRSPAGCARVTYEREANGSRREVMLLISGTDSVAF